MTDLLRSQHHDHVDRFGFFERAALPAHVDKVMNGLNRRRFLAQMAA